MSTEVPALHLRIPAYRGQAAHSGAVLSELPFTPAIEAYFDRRRRGQGRARKASQWWKVPELVALLRAHPEGRALLALLLPPLEGDVAWTIAAQRAGLSEPDLHALHKHATTMLQEEWNRWRACARSANCAPSSDCA